MGTKKNNNESVKTTSVEVKDNAKAAKAPKAEKAAKKESAAKAEKPKVEKPKAAAKTPKVAPKAAEKAAKVSAPKVAAKAPKVAAKTPKAAEKAAKVVAPKAAKVAKADAKPRGRQAEGVFQEEIDYIIAKIRRAAAENRMSRKDQDEYDDAKAKGLRVQPRYSCYHSAALLTSTLEYIKSIGVEYERDCNGKGHRFRFFVPKKGTKAYKTVIG